jgi:transmembrane sensor
MNDFDPAVAAQLAPRWDAERMAGNLTQIEHRLERKRVSLQWGIAVAALTTSAAVIGVVFGYWPTHKLGFFSTTRTTAVAAVGSHAPATETHFRDGSTATALTQGAVLELRTTSDTEMVVVAKSGAFRFEVVPNPARQFVVEVGTVTVRVLGTRFVVAQQDQRVEVRVERGRVGVSWSDGRTELGSDESGWFPPLPETLQSPPAASAAEPVSASTRGLHAASERSQFIELSRKGDYQAAYAIVDRAPQLFGGSAEDLMMAADAARLSNHPQQAVGYLQRVTKEHPSDSRAPLAAFTLGRIYMSQLGLPAAAARAFALVRQLAPAGALVEDALAREAEALEQAGQHAAAQQLVQAYLKQYPTGRRSESLRKLVH